MSLNTKSKKIIIICTDFNLNLKLYKLPNSLKSKITKNKKIKIINFDYKNRLCKEAIIYWGNLIDDKKIKFLQKLKWIHLGSVGYDKIKDLSILKKIKLTNSKKIMSDAVSESIFNFIFIFLKRFDQASKLRLVKRLTRKDFDLHYEQVKIMRDCKFLIFGGGNISINLINKLKNFSKNITLVSSRLYSSHSIKKYYSINTYKKKKLDYDFIISILPDKKKYLDYFNFNFFKSMKKDSFFINVGRGSVVNEIDLIKSLSKKIIAGAALDVFKNEPITSTNPLFKFSNCLITPHTAGLFNNYWIEQEKLFLLNLKNFLSGKKLKNIVNPLFGK
jgi:phosphoglycerate dehydrogenase-like enzyme